ncbi:MAG: hypothetical protein NVS9B15_12850 [Acidobacteriaceae bacterium]
MLYLKSERIRTHSDNFAAENGSICFTNLYVMYGTSGHNLLLRSQSVISRRTQRGLISKQTGGD